jgi:hypothetical protein
MATSEGSFREGKALQATSIRDLGLTIAGTQLEPIVAEFLAEVERIGISRLRPRVYLSTEWGVPFNTVAIAVPFYLARPELTALHAEQVGHVEGVDRADILRYLRHEMGHVVNYAYHLYDDVDWIKHFGSMTQPYEEDYRPEPFSPRFVDHLPGWYAQKHPDEDWAETFAVWMTPGHDWRSEYADRPVAMSKLSYCDRVMAGLKNRLPVSAAEDLDEEVGQLAYSLETFYQQLPNAAAELLPGLDGALRAIFPDRTDASSSGVRPAADLIRRLETLFLANVYRWTGHFPERTRWLLRHLANRSQTLERRYQEDQETAAIIGLTTLITALAMNHVHHGSYIPNLEGPSSGTVSPAG